MFFCISIERRWYYIFLIHIDYVHNIHNIMSYLSIMLLSDLFSTPVSDNWCQKSQPPVSKKTSCIYIYTWQPLGPLLKVKLLVGPTCKIPRSTQRGCSGIRRSQLAWGLLALQTFTCAETAKQLKSHPLNLAKKKCQSLPCAITTGFCLKKSGASLSPTADFVLLVFLIYNLFKSLLPFKFKHSNLLNCSTMPPPPGTK